MLALNPIETASDLSLVSAQLPAAEILNRHKIDWRVDTVPVYLPSGRAIPGTFANVRTDTGAPVGVVGSRYKVIQNSVKLSLLDACAEKGLIQGYSNAGTFGGGKIVWVQAELTGSLSIGPDEIKKYLLLAGSHDGSGTDRSVVTPVRVVCRNTLMMGRAAEGGLTLRHTQAGIDRLQAARAAIQGAQRFYAAFERQATNLLSAKMSCFEMVQFADALFPAPREKEETSRATNIKSQVVDLYDNGRGQYGVRGTRWAAYNAVTEYADHHRATRRGEGGAEESRLQSAWLGSGAALKARAWDMLTGAAA